MSIARCLLLAVLPLLAQPAAAALPQHLRDTGLYAKGSSSELRAGRRRRSRRSTRCGPTAPRSGAGSSLPPGTVDRCVAARRLGVPASARGCGRSSRFGRPRRDALHRAAAGRHVALRRRTSGTRTARDAVLAPAGGHRALPVRGAPRGRYAIPSRSDCRACHDGAAVPVLGFSALQLSPDRDPLAPHARAPQRRRRRSRALVARGWLRNLPPALLDAAAAHRGGDAGRARRARLPARQLRHCHNARAGAPVAGRPDARAGRRRRRPQRRAVLRSARRRAEPLSPAGRTARARVDRARASRRRACSRCACARAIRASQMPPLGTQLPDAEALALLERWIGDELPTTASQPRRPDHERNPLPRALASCSRVAGASPRCRRGRHSPRDAAPMHRPTVARGKYLVDGRRLQRLPHAVEDGRRRPRAGHEPHAVGPPRGAGDAAGADAARRPVDRRRRRRRTPPWSGPGA